MKHLLTALMLLLTFPQLVNAKEPEWAAVNKFGSSTTYVDLTSIKRNGSLVLARVRYVLIPPGTDRRNGKSVKEMLMAEEYETDTILFRIHEIQFVYTDGAASDSLSTEPAWKPATGGNFKTLEFLRRSNGKN
ncbi:MAG: hypothetical protein Q8O79_06445 [Pseudomonadota bacterium]|nr:hypothetical protein [Pseudomonadota bacterium]